MIRRICVPDSSNTGIQDTSSIENILQKCENPEKYECLVKIFNVNMNSKGEFAVTQQIKQEFNGNVYGGVNNTETGNITTNTMVNQNETEDIVQQLNELKQLIGLIKEIDEENKECVTDDIVVLNEQLIAESPSKVRINKAINGIKEFITSLPKALEYTDKIVTLGGAVIERITSMF